MNEAVGISLIAAVADNGVIGDGSDLPWRLSTDMRRFKKLTLGKPVIMGRKTFETLPGPLPGRTNIVVTRQTNYRAADVKVFASVAAAIGWARKTAAPALTASEIMVIGGGEVYAQSMAFADRLYMTHVEGHPEGITVFPKIDPEAWIGGVEEHVPSGERDSAPTRFVIYRRRLSSPPLAPPG